MPKLWNTTIETHRREVRDAILDAAAALVAEEGLLAVTMSQIAQRTGIGRATLYKYFSDVAGVLVAWHDRHVTAHLAQLTELRAGEADPAQRLAAVLRGYAHIAEARANHDLGADVAALVHRQQHVAEAQRQLHALLRDTIAEAAAAGAVRTDIDAGELATFCLQALSANAPADHVVTLTLTALSGGPRWRPSGPASRRQRTPPAPRR